MSKFTESQIEAIKSSLDTFTDDDFQELHDDMLRETTEGGTVTIAGLEYDVVDALRSVDPTAYRCSVADYTSVLMEDYTEIESGLYVNTSELEDLIEDLQAEGA